MKRWHLFTDEHVGGAPWRDVEEDPDGEWVKAEDVALAQAVIEALPRCDAEGCDKAATRVWHDERERYCEEHCGDFGDDLPYAEALRAYQAR